jgi:hypothetical protein
MENGEKKVKKKAELSTASVEIVKSLDEKITKKLTKVMDEVSLDCNKILNIYGMKAEIHWGVTAK